MSSVAAIRQALADLVADIGGIQAFPYILENPTPPCAMVYSAETQFDVSMGRGTDRRDMVVRVVVPFGNDIVSQMLLDEMRDGSGPRSLKQAIQKDDTLGGACQRLRVVSCSADTVYGGSLGKVIGIGCEFQIELYASGT